MTGLFDCCVFMCRNFTLQIVIFLGRLLYLISPNLPVQDYCHKRFQVIHWFWMTQQHNLVFRTHLLPTREQYLSLPMSFKGKAPICFSTAKSNLCSSPSNVTGTRWFGLGCWVVHTGLSPKAQPHNGFIMFVDMLDLMIGVHWY